MANSQNNPDHPISLGEFVAKKGSNCERIQWIGNVVLVRMLVPDGKGHYTRERWWVDYGYAPYLERFREQDHAFGIRTEGVVPRVPFSVKEAFAILCGADRSETIGGDFVKVSWVFNGRMVAHGSYDGAEQEVSLYCDPEHLPSCFTGEEATKLIDCGDLVVS